MEMQYLMVEISNICRGEKPQSDIADLILKQTIENLSFEQFRSRKYINVLMIKVESLTS